MYIIYFDGFTAFVDKDAYSSGLFLISKANDSLDDSSSQMKRDKYVR